MSNLINELHDIADDFSADDYSVRAELIRDAIEEIERLRAVCDPSLPDVVGIPMLVKNFRGWEVLGEDGARFRLALVSAAPLKPTA